jgi:hypothetical protein
VGIGMELIISLIIVMCMHPMIGMYVDKMRFVNHEARTNYALIPFANVYLLGKYAVDVLIGIAMLIITVLGMRYFVTVFGVKYGFNLLPNAIRITLYIISFIATIILLVYVAMKYARITNHKDRIDLDDLIYYIKETLWIIILFVAVYLFAMFVIGVGTGAIVI